LKDDSLSRIGSRIKKERKKRKISLQSLAEKSNLSAGLISKIENFRTVPSLPTLLGLANALGVKLSDLVNEVTDGPELPYTLVKKNTGEQEEREDSKGLLYESLISRDVFNINFRANIVTLQPSIERPPVSTDGMELIHVLHGSVSYGIGKDKVTLYQGDTLYFDGSFPHSVKNNSDAETLLFKVYLMQQPE
jgi:transcriptional regulator with XRE-family HTH domain